MFTLGTGLQSPDILIPFRCTAKQVSSQDRPMTLTHSDTVHLCSGFLYQIVSAPLSAPRTGSAFLHYRLLPSATVRYTVTADRVNPVLAVITYPVL
jgi:hypothetical protein